MRDRPLPFNNVAVFPTKTGGRGLRFQTMHPDFLCILLMCTPKCLHGSVFPNALPPAAAQLPVGIKSVRAIHYP